MRDGDNVGTATGNTSPGRWPQVRVEQGMVRGITVNYPSAENGMTKTFAAFLGIPYAKPPVKSLRFKAPVAHPGWNDREMLECNMFRSACPQYDVRGSIIGNEDCLHLNAYVPWSSDQQFNNKSSKTKYSVMIFIQGESFDNGDSSIYGPARFVDDGVILVTFNYRIGVLGFLSSGDDLLPGNFGLKDQRFALEWVHRNIANFNGDSSSITIFGQGSGAASVLYQTLTPTHSGNLFHRAIVQSGSPLCDWALERQPITFFKSVAHQVGCSLLLDEFVGNNNRSLIRRAVECLREAPIDQLLKSQTSSKILSQFPQRAAPVVESPHTIEAFILEDPRDTLLMGNFHHVPLIAGFTSNEGAFFYPSLVNAFNYQSNSLEESLVERLIDSATPYRWKTTNSSRMQFNEARNAVKNAILHSYFQSAQSANLSQVAVSFINASSDALYASCIDETLKMYARHEPRQTFMYLFDYTGGNTMTRLINNAASLSFNTGACHADDLFYLFSLNIEHTLPMTRIDRRISQRLVRLWTDFSKFGRSPNFDNYEYPRWPIFTPESLAYLRIGMQLFPDRSYHQRELSFWNRHLPRLFEATSHHQIDEFMAISNNLSLILSSQTDLRGESAQPHLTDLRLPLRNRPMSDVKPQRSPGDTINKKIASIAFGPGELEDTSINRADIFEQGSHNVILGRFAFTMTGVSVTLLIIVVCLILTLYVQRKRQTFNTWSTNAAFEDGSRFGAFGCANNRLSTIDISDSTVIPATLTLLY